MLLQTNSYVVPKERRAEHQRLLRRFRQTLARLGCEHFEVYEQVGANWSSGDSTGRYVQIMRFRDRRHQLQVQASERSDPGAQAVIAEFCNLINFPYQQQQGLFAVGFYTSVLPVATFRLQGPGAPEALEGEPEAEEEALGEEALGEEGLGEEALGEEEAAEGDAYEPEALEEEQVEEGAESGEAKGEPAEELLELEAGEEAETDEEAVGEEAEQAEQVEEGALDEAENEGEWEEEAEGVEAVGELDEQAEEGEVAEEEVEPGAEDEAAEAGEEVGEETEEEESAEWAEGLGGDEGEALEGEEEAAGAESEVGAEGSETEAAAETEQGSETELSAEEGGVEIISEQIPVARAEAVARRGGRPAEGGEEDAEGREDGGFEALLSSEEFLQGIDFEEDNGGAGHGAPGADSPLTPPGLEPHHPHPGGGEDRANPRAGRNGDAFDEHEDAGHGHAAGR